LFAITKFDIVTRPGKEDSETFEDSDGNEQESLANAKVSD